VIDFNIIWLKGENVMDKSNVLVDLGTVGEVSLKHDLENPVHIRCSATLDHDIDDDKIKEAWDRTKRVYPVIDAVLGFEHGDAYFYMDPKAKAKYSDDHVYLVQTDTGTNEPVKTKVPIAPGTDTVGKRLICISYYERKVSISAYHILTDGSGLNKIFSTFLYSYLALYTGHEDEKPVVELTEGRAPEAYYMASINKFIYSQEYSPVPLYSLPPDCKGFDDKGLQFDGNFYVGSVSVPTSDFIKLCKTNGANPSSMLCTLMAKAAYAVNVGETKDIVFCMTLSLKNILGLDNDISNASSFAVTYAAHDDVINGSLAEVSQKIRKEVDMQRTKDYCITYQRSTATYTYIPKFRPRMVTYLGTVNIGDNTNHIVDFSMETDGHFVVYMIQLKDNFIITFQYDNVTENYLNELKNVFNELGIKAEITQPVAKVLIDSQTAVL
jgi:hypothetical protein